jgi:hypothetical protein
LAAVGNEKSAQQSVLLLLSADCPVFSGARSAASSPYPLIGLRHLFRRMRQMLCCLDRQVDQCALDRMAGDGPADNRGDRIFDRLIQPD